MRNADAADSTTGPGDADGGEHGLLSSHAFENANGRRAPGKLAHVFHRLFAALAHDVRRAECFRQLNSVRVTAQNDDLLRAEPLRRNDAAQTDRAVAHDGYFFAAPTFAATAA